VVADRAAARRRQREARREAKQLARQKRTAARRAVAEAAAVRQQTPPDTDAEAVADDEVESAAEAQTEDEAEAEAQTEAEAHTEAEAVETALDDAEPETLAVETIEPQAVADETAVDETAADEPVPLSQVLAAAGAFDRPHPVDAPERADPTPEVESSTSQARGSDRSGRRSRDERAAARVATRPPKRDRIVEAPREPKTPWGQRLGSLGRSARSDRPPGTAGAGAKRVVSVLAGLVGAAGLVCSVVLAFGALLVALDATDSSVYDSVSGICDVLVGPLRDAFSFTGTNADMKESLVAWGAGAIAYLVMGIGIQSLLRSAVDD
jgi:hypothetical protein